MKSNNLDMVNRIYGDLKLEGLIKMVKGKSGKKKKRLKGQLPIGCFKNYKEYSEQFNYKRDKYGNKKISWWDKLLKIFERGLHVNFY